PPLKAWLAEHCRRRICDSQEFSETAANGRIAGGLGGLIRGAAHFAFSRQLNAGRSRIGRRFRSGRADAKSHRPGAHFSVHRRASWPVFAECAQLGVEALGRFAYSETMSEHAYLFR